MFNSVYLFFIFVLDKVFTIPLIIKLNNVPFNYVSIIHSFIKVVSSQPTIFKIIVELLEPVKFQISTVPQHLFFLFLFGRDSGLPIGAFTSRLRRFTFRF